MNDMNDNKIPTATIATNRQPSQESQPIAETLGNAVYVAAGGDRFSEHILLGGIAPNECKVSSQDTKGAMSIFESLTPFKGGPPLHVHHDQDEWFYVLEGEFDFQVGDDRYRLRSGESVLAPRRIAHAWACVSDTPGKMMIVFQPAGAMEDFFRELGKLNGPPPPDQAQGLFCAHGMQIVGPPLAIS
jgi:quercetin dioxygenase-like cupin family protein